MDVVQPSPRTNDRAQKHLSPDHMTKHQIDALNKKLGVKLDKKQLAAILKEIEDAENAATNTQPTMRNNPRKSNLRQQVVEEPSENLRLDFDRREEPTRQKFTNLNQNQYQNYDDDIKIYRPPQVVVAEDPTSPSPFPTSYNNRNEIVNKSILSSQENSRQLSFAEKKKLKWQMDKGTYI